MPLDMRSLEAGSLQQPKRRYEGAPGGLQDKTRIQPTTFGPRAAELAVAQRTVNFSEFHADSCRQQ